MGLPFGRLNTFADRRRKDCIDLGDLDGVKTARVFDYCEALGVISKGSCHFLT
jgi:hypothetical protein